MGCLQSFHRGIKSANTFFVMLTGSNCCDFSTLTHAVIHTKTHTRLWKALKIHHFCTDRKIATVLRLTDVLKDGNQGEMRNELHTKCKHNKEKCMITVYRSNYRWWRKPHGSKCLPDVRNQHATLNWVKMCVFLICVFLCVCETWRQILGCGPALLKYEKGEVQWHQQVKPVFSLWQEMMQAPVCVCVSVQR